MDPARRCTATAKGTGEQCKRPAAVGSSVCVKHGGGAPQVRAAAARRVAEDGARRAMATYGSPVQVEPLQALLGELWRTAGHVAWLGELIADLDHGEDESGLRQYTKERGVSAEKPSVWVEMYQHERAHLARVAKDCLSVGIEERLVRLAEDQARAMAEVMRSFAVAVGLDPADEGVRAAMRRSLTVGAARAA